MPSLLSMFIHENQDLISKLFLLPTFYFTIWNHKFQVNFLFCNLLWSWCFSILIDKSLWHKSAPESGLLQWQDWNAGFLEESAHFGNFGLGQWLHTISRAYWTILVGDCKTVGERTLRLWRPSSHSFQSKTILATVPEIILLIFWQRHLLCAIFLRTYYRWD